MPASDKIKRCNNNIFVSYSNYDASCLFTDLDGRKGAVPQLPIFHSYHDYQATVPTLTLVIQDNPLEALIIQSAESLRKGEMVCIKPQYLFYDERDVAHLKKFKVDRAGDTGVKYTMTCNGKVSHASVVIHNDGRLSPSSEKTTAAIIAAEVIKQTLATNQPGVIITTINNIADNRKYAHRKLNNKYVTTTLIYPEALIVSLQQIMSNLGDNFSIGDLKRELANHPDHPLLSEWLKKETIKIDTLSSPTIQVPTAPTPTPVTNPSTTPSTLFSSNRAIDAPPTFQLSNLADKLTPEQLKQFVDTWPRGKACGEEHLQALLHLVDIKKTALEAAIAEVSNLTREQASKIYRNSDHALK